jgi:hypothetical protein
MESRKGHINRPQAEVLAVDANTEVVVAGRGIGKSTMIIAPRAARCVFEMPQSLGLFVAKSFMQLKTKTLPPVIEGWRLLGYQRDKDFVIGKRGPQHWPIPYFMPEDLRNFIHWRNGTGIMMISMERPGSANGLSSDWKITDESKFIDRERYMEEIMPTLRGSTAGPARVHWSKKSLYKSVMYVTDMPTSNQADWIFEFEKMMDREQIRAIKYYFYEREKKRIAFFNTRSDSYRKRLLDEINALDAILNDLRKDAVHYIEASALDNLEVLGVSYLKQMKKELSPLVYRTSVLNERLKRIENGFYPDWKPERHGQSWTNDEFLDSLGYDMHKLSSASKDSRADGGIDTSKGLSVALDNGGNFNCVVTGQRIGNEYRVFSGFHVSGDKLVRDLARKWCDYHKHHPTKVMYYYYDHTAIPKYGTTKETYKSQWISACQDRGWKVIPKYIGKTPDYEVRHTFWSDLLRAIRSDLPEFRYSTDHCQSMEISVLNAPAKEGRSGIEKDKSNEDLRKGVRPEHATHYSDALDTLVFGELKKGSASSAGYGSGGGVV